MTGRVLASSRSIYVGGKRVCNELLVKLITLSPESVLPSQHCGRNRRFIVNGVLGNYDPIQSELAENVTLRERAVEATML
jgi:hypothetical protein